MMRTRLPIALAAALLLAACEPNPPADAGAGAADPVADAVATVDGEPISRAQLDVYAARRGPQADPQALVDDLVSIELLAQEAIRQGIDRRPQTAGELASQRNAILAQAVVRERLDAQSIDDAAIQAEYERFAAEETGEELKARHILVDSEERAAELIAQLDQGADFAALASEHSSDGSAAQGGDLGWFGLDMMVEPFGERAAALEVGQYTDEPVQTRFGWHVIQLDDRRRAQPPPLDEVREEIRGYLQSQAIEAWVNELRGEAEVEILLEAEAPAEEAPPVEAPAEEAPAEGGTDG